MCIKYRPCSKIVSRVHTSTYFNLPISQNSTFIDPQLLRKESSNGVLPQPMKCCYSQGIDYVYGFSDYDDCFQLAHFSSEWLNGYISSSCYYHHQIGSIHLSHCYHLFRGCVPEMFVTSYSVTYCIYVPGKSFICFHYYCAVYDECKYSDTLWLADRTRLFVQYTISLSSLCKLIWRHWTYKMPVRYILSSVWVRLSIFSPLSIIWYVWLYVFSLPISLVMIEIICILCGVGR